jgi:hypothetical protein
MSKLGIGLLFFALLGALVSLGLGFVLIQRFGSAQSTITQTQQSLTAAQHATTVAKQQTDAANQAKDQANTELTEEQGKLTDANAKLATAQKAQDDLNTSLTQAKADADKAKADLQHVTDVLGNMSPEDAKAALQKAQGDLATAQSQLKILQDQYQASQKQIADLMDAVNREKVGTMPPGISGKITFVNRAWNFVVLNVGLSNGVVPNGELIVYRGRNFLGKVKVTSAEAGTAVADILPNAKADIQIGDDVLN